MNDSDAPEEHRPDGRTVEWCESNDIVDLGDKLQFVIFFFKKLTAFIRVVKRGDNLTIFKKSYDMKMILIRQRQLGANGLTNFHRSLSY